MSTTKQSVALLQLQLEIFETLACDEYGALTAPGARAPDKLLSGEEIHGLRRLELGAVLERIETARALLLAVPEGAELALTVAAIVQDFARPLRAAAVARQEAGRKGARAAKAKKKARTDLRDKKLRAMASKIKSAPSINAKAKRLSETMNGSLSARQIRKILSK